MPYFIFRFYKSGEEITDLEYVDSIDNFKQAKAQVRQMRAAIAKDNAQIVRMVFAGTREEATARLLEKRIAPILREWEK